MNGDAIVSLAAIAAALVLAYRGLKARPMAPRKRLTMAAMWVLIIVAVTFAIHSLNIGHAQ